MGGIKRKCIICGKEYEWCGNCSDTINKNETWRNLYCSENCRNIYNILTMHSLKHTNDQQAGDQLKNVDLSKLESFRDDFKDEIKKIQSKSKVEEKSKEIETKKAPFFGNQSKPQPQQNKEIVKHNSKDDK